MVALPHWVTWNLTKDGKKVPQQRINDPHSWLTLSEALKNPGTGGIGFVLVDSDDIGGVDLDGCMDPETGSIDPWAQQLISMFSSYSEVSPSGTGVKIFARGCPPALPAHVIPIREGKNHGGKTSQVEVYTSGRFFAVTGNCLPDFDPQDPLTVAASAWLKITEFLQATTVMSKNKAKPQPQLGHDGEEVVSDQPKVVTRGSRNIALTRLAGILRRQGLTVDGMNAALQEENKATCVPPLTVEEVRTIVNSVVRYTPSEETGNPFGGKIPTNSQPHLLMAFDRMNISFAYNLFTEEPEITYPKSLFGDESEAPITQVYDDYHRRRLYFMLERDFFCRTSPHILDDFIQDRCMERPHHPVREYLATLKWDGVPRIDTWLEDYMGVVPDNEDTKKYVRAVGAITLMAAVRRIKYPGCKFDNMLIFEGQQNAGKSMTLMALAPNEDWVLEDFSLGADAKIAIERTGGKWLVEVSEMTVSRSADINKVKAFLSLRSDVARKAYGRKTTKQPRGFIFIGTTNELAAYLAAADGNRRYWPCKVGNKVDLAGIRLVRDQLWAEAQYREDGALLYLTEELFEIAVRQQSSREVIDPWQERLESIAGDKHGWWRFDSLWTRIDKPVGNTSPADSRRLSMVMHRMKFKSEVKYIKRFKLSMRVWMRMTEESHGDVGSVPPILEEDKRWEFGGDEPILYNKDPSFL